MTKKYNNMINPTLNIQKELCIKNMEEGVAKYKVETTLAMFQAKKIGKEMKEYRKRLFCFMVVVANIKAAKIENETTPVHAFIKVNEIPLLKIVNPSTVAVIPTLVRISLEK